MAISKKQGIAIGVGVVAVAAIVGGVFAAVNLNSRAAEAASTPAPSEANTATDEIVWFHTDPVPEAVEALEASGFEPIEAGKLTVAIGAFVPPLSYQPDGTSAATEVAGTEPNIGSLIAEGLGLEYNPQVVAWADWPLGIQSGKYDLITSNVTVTEERKELYDFASYREDLLGFYVMVDSDIESISEAADISGLKITVGSGTNQEQVLLRWNEELEADGKTPQSSATTTTAPRPLSPCSPVASMPRSGRTPQRHGRRSRPETRSSSASCPAGGPTPPTSPRARRRATA